MTAIRKTGGKAAGDPAIPQENTGTPAGGTPPADPASTGMGGPDARDLRTEADLLKLSPSRGTHIRGLNRFVPGVGNPSKKRAFTAKEAVLLTTRWGASLDPQDPDYITREDSGRFTYEIELRFDSEEELDVIKWLRRPSVQNHLATYPFKDRGALEQIEHLLSRGEGAEGPETDLTRLIAAEKASAQEPRNGRPTSRRPMTARRAVEAAVELAKKDDLITSDLAKELMTKIIPFHFIGNAVNNTLITRSYLEHREVLRIARRDGVPPAQAVNVYLMEKMSDFITREPVSEFLAGLDYLPGHLTRFKKFFETDVLRFSRNPLKRRIDGTDRSITLKEALLNALNWAIENEIIPNSDFDESKIDRLRREAIPALFDFRFDPRASAAKYRAIEEELGDDRSSRPTRRESPEVAESGAIAALAVTVDDFVTIPEVAGRLSTLSYRPGELEMLAFYLDDIRPGLASNPNMAPLLRRLRAAEETVKSGLDAIDILQRAVYISSFGGAGSHSARVLLRNTILPTLFGRKADAERPLRSDVHERWRDALHNLFSNRHVVRYLIQFEFSEGDAEKILSFLPETMPKDMPSDTWARLRIHLESNRAGAIGSPPHPSGAEPVRLEEALIKMFRWAVQNGYVAERELPDLDSPEFDISELLSFRFHQIYRKKDVQDFLAQFEYSRQDLDRLADWIFDRNGNPYTQSKLVDRALSVEAIAKKYRYQRIADFGISDEKGMQNFLELLEKFSPTGKTLVEAYRKHNIPIQYGSEGGTFCRRDPAQFLERDKLPATEIHLERNAPPIEAVVHELAHAIPQDEMAEEARRIGFRKIEMDMTPEQVYAASVDNSYAEELIATLYEVRVYMELMEAGIHVRTDSKSSEYARRMNKLVEAYKAKGIAGLRENELQVGQNHRIDYNARALGQLYILLITQPDLLKERGITIARDDSGRIFLEGVDPHRLRAYLNEFAPVLMDRWFGMGSDVPEPELGPLPREARWKSDPSTISKTPEETRYRIQISGHFIEFFQQFQQGAPSVTLNDLIGRQGEWPLEAALTLSAGMKGDARRRMLATAGRMTGHLTKLRHKKPGISFDFILTYTLALMSAGYDQEGHRYADLYTKESGVSILETTYRIARAGQLNGAYLFLKNKSRDSLVNTSRSLEWGGRLLEFLDEGHPAEGARFRQLMEPFWAKSWEDLKARTLRWLNRASRRTGSEANFWRRLDDALKNAGLQIVRLEGELYSLDSETTEDQFNKAISGERTKIDKYKEIAGEAVYLITSAMKEGRLDQALGYLEETGESLMFKRLLPHFIKSIPRNLPAERLRQLFARWDKLILDAKIKTEGYSFYRCQYLLYKGLAFSKHSDTEVAREGLEMLRNIPSGEGYIKIRDRKHDRMLKQERLRKAGATAEEMETFNEADDAASYWEMIIEPHLKAVIDMQYKGANALNLTKAQYLLDAIERHPQEKARLTAHAEKLLSDVPLTIDEGHNILEERQRLLLAVSKRWAEIGEHEKSGDLLKRIERESFDFVDRVADYSGGTQDKSIEGTSVASGLVPRLRMMVNERLSRLEINIYRDRVKWLLTLEMLEHQSDLLAIRPDAEEAERIRGRIEHSIETRRGEIDMAMIGRIAAKTARVEALRPAAAEIFRLGLRRMDQQKNGSTDFFNSLGEFSRSVKESEIATEEKDRIFARAVEQLAPLLKFSPEDVQSAASQLTALSDFFDRVSQKNLYPSAEKALLKVMAGMAHQFNYSASDASNAAMLKILSDLFRVVQKHHPEAVDPEQFEHLWRAAGGDQRTREALYDIFPEKVKEKAKEEAAEWDLTLLRKGLIDPGDALKRIEQEIPRLLKEGRASERLETLKKVSIILGENELRKISPLREPKTIEAYWEICPVLKFLADQRQWAWLMEVSRPNALFSLRTLYYHLLMNDEVPAPIRQEALKRLGANNMIMTAVERSPEENLKILGKFLRVERAIPDARLFWLATHPDTKGVFARSYQRLIREGEGWKADVLNAPDLDLFISRERLSHGRMIRFFKILACLAPEKRRALLGHKVEVSTRLTHDEQYDIRVISEGHASDITETADLEWAFIRLRASFDAEISALTRGTNIEARFDDIDWKELSGRVEEKDRAFTKETEETEAAARGRVMKNLPPLFRFIVDKFLEASSPADRRSIQEEFDKLGEEMSWEDAVCWFLKVTGNQKLAQILSTQRSLFPASLIEKLETFKDRVEPSRFDEVIEVIERELGRPHAELFESIDRNPIGSASIGEVYETTLKNGTRVVIKVITPSKRELIQKNLETLKKVAEAFEGKKLSLPVPPNALYRILALSIQNEMDFALEYENARLLAAALPEGFQMPKYFAEFKKESVLVMTKAKGVKISEIENKELRQAIGLRLGDMLSEMIFVYGIYHEDLHEGNFFVDPVTGEITLIDVGRVGQLTPPNRLKWRQFLEKVALQDADGLALALADMSLSRRAAAEHDHSRLVEDLRRIFGQAGSLSTSALINRVLDAARSHDLQVHGTYLKVLKAMLTVEAVATKLDPMFNFAAPIFKAWLKMDWLGEISDEIQGIRKAMTITPDQIRPNENAARRHLEKIDAAIKAAEESGGPEAAAGLMKAAYYAIETGLSPTQSARIMMRIRLMGFGPGAVRTPSRRSPPRGRRPRTAAAAVRPPAKRPARTEVRRARKLEDVLRSKTPDFGEFVAALKAEVERRGGDFEAISRELALQAMREKSNAQVRLMAVSFVIGFGKAGLEFLLADVGKSIVSGDMQALDHVIKHMDDLGQTHCWFYFGGAAAGGTIDAVMTAFPSLKNGFSPTVLNHIIKPWLGLVIGSAMNEYMTTGRLDWASHAKTAVQFKVVGLALAPLRRMLAGTVVGGVSFSSGPVGVLVGAALLGIELTSVHVYNKVVAERNQAESVVAAAHKFNSERSGSNGVKLAEALSNYAVSHGLFADQTAINTAISEGGYATIPDAGDENSKTLLGHYLKKMGVERDGRQSERIHFALGEEDHNKKIAQLVESSARELASLNASANDISGGSTYDSHQMRVDKLNRDIENIPASARADRLFTYLHGLRTARQAIKNRHAAMSIPDLKYRIELFEIERQIDMTETELRFLEDAMQLDSAEMTGVIQAYAIVEFLKSEEWNKKKTDFLNRMFAVYREPLEKLWKRDRLIRWGDVHMANITNYAQAVSLSLPEEPALIYLFAEYVRLKTKETQEKKEDSPKPQPDHLQGEPLLLSLALK